MKYWIGLAVALAAAGCADMTGAKDIPTDIETQTGAADARAQENDTRTSLGQIETALAAYVKAENKIPDDLDALVPKYLGAIPPLDVTVCGRRTEDVQKYSSDVLHDGQVDGTRIKGRGLWGYVHDGRRVVVFVDCLKPSANGTPWYQIRGIY
jgi:hypothetical protein